MTRACVAFAAVRTLARMNSPEWQQPGRTTYWPGSIRRIPGREVPLLVDHDFRIGTVTDIVEMDWPSGRWFCGLADVTDVTLLRPGQGASFGYIPTSAYNDDLGDRVERAFVKEITVCVKTQPVEPEAQLVTIHRSPPATVRIPAPAQVRRLAPIHPKDEEVAELRRRQDWHEAHGTGATLEAILECMKRELNAPRARLRLVG